MCYQTAIELHDDATFWIYFWNVIFMYRMLSFKNDNHVTLAWHFL